MIIKNYKPANATSMPPGKIIELIPRYDGFIKAFEQYLISGCRQHDILSSTNELVSLFFSSLNPKVLKTLEAENMPKLCVVTSPVMKVKA